MLEFSHFLANATPGDGGNMVTQITDQMGVNWPQFLSQTFLFLILILALIKYAFGPVQKVLEKRKEIIDETLDNAERVRQELASAEAARKDILKKADARAAEIIEQATTAAENLARRRQAEAIKEAEQYTAKSREAMRLERERMEVELRREIVRLVADVTQRVTGKILTPEDHKRLNDETLTQVSRN